MPGSREPTPAVATGTHAERVTGHSLHDAIDDAIEHVVENDRQHPPHDEVSTASRDEELAGTPAAPKRRHGKLVFLVVAIAVAIVGLAAAVWK